MNKKSRVLGPLLLFYLNAFIRPSLGNGFQCSQGFSVPPDNVCDFTDQCGDGSDEVSCSRYERCDFETDLCGMTSEGWLRTNGLKAGSVLFDQKKNITAHFLVFPSENLPGAQAVLRSRHFFPTDDQISCELRLYYYFADVSSELTVGLQIQTQDQVNDIWKQDSSHKKEWRRGVITISSSEPFQIIIKAVTLGNGTSESIAIDDISFSEGCKPANEMTLSCGFSEDTCTWTSKPSLGHIPWRHTSEATIPNMMSVQNNRGHFLLVDGNPSNLQKRAYLKSSPFHRSKAKSCRFHFRYMIEKDNSLRLLLYSDEKEIILFEENMSTKGQWVEGEVSLPGSWEDDVQIAFEGTVRNLAGFIALDEFTCTCCKGYSPISTNGSRLNDESISDFPNECSDEDLTISRDFNTCDFEFGFCEWKPLNTNGEVWKITGANTFHDIRLNGDHTTDGDYGRLIYVSADSTNGEDVPSSQLESNFLVRPAAGAQCQLQFWYQMWESSKISVFKRTLHNEGSELLHEISGPTDNKWTKATLTIKSDARDSAQIILEATLFSPRALVAIDDIGLSLDCVTSDTFSGKSKEPMFFRCRSDLFSCGDGSCISRRKRCDFTKDCANGINENLCPAKCDFETDDCGWHEMRCFDFFNWVRHSRSSLAQEYLSQAPPVDHTTSSTQGHFMFIQKKDRNFTQTAELRSPRFSQAGQGCSMTFWYYNYGSSVGTAEILLHIDNEKAPTVLWSTYYNQGNQWLKGFIQLDRLSHPFQLSVKKTNLGYYEGVSAIDDIMFENCSLPTAVPNCTGADFFWCKDTKACISSLLVCDLIDDCGDGSDEINCTSELQCDFEDGLCNWMQDTDDDFDWTRHQGQTPTLDTGPMKDHSLGTAQGHYLYIETSEPQLYRNQAILLSPEIEATVNNENKSCIFRFHYHMFGRQIYSLAVYKRTRRNARGQLLWQSFGNKGNRWLKKILFINSSLPFQLLITGRVGDGFTGDIAIDDISFFNCTLHDGALPTWSPIPLATSTKATLPVHNCSVDQHVCRSTGHCIPIPKLCDFRADCLDGSDEDNCVSEYCNFENGTSCNWFQPGAASFHWDTTFQWTVGQGVTVHPGEETHRPLKDHTTATEEGWYLYADSSNGEFGHTAHIMTPLISQTGPKCKLTFWTHMNGATVGSLQVLIRLVNVTYEVWFQSGRQGARWRRAEVYLGTLSNFQIVLVAKRGVSYVGDVSVDDMSFEYCSPVLINDKPCTSEEFMCANKYCIPKNNLCDFVNDCSDNSDEDRYLCGSFLGRCNFEFDLCDWRQCQTDKFDWSMRAGSTPTVGTGPVTDHTLQNPAGFYIFIEGSFPHLPGQEAKLFGPVISKWSRNCTIIFYFHMYGVGIGSLTIYQVTASRRETLLLNLTGDQGNFWQRKEIQLHDLGEDFYITLEGKVGRDQRGDIALDDIVLSNQCLPSSALAPASPRLRPGKDTCPVGFLECQNKKCYMPERLCDFVNDCGDNTDETQCGTSCTFEGGTCGWKNSMADNFDWILGGHSSRSLTPPVDHTLGSKDGHFLYLEPSYVGLRGEKAHLRSSKWKESARACVLRFWYYMSSKATGRIRVLIKTENNLTKVWGVSENKDGKWNKVDVYLGKLRHFEVIFQGIRIRDFGGGAAIDDIEFVNCSPVGEEPGKCREGTDFICKNQKCIESHLMCDYKSDCEDSSDEADCSDYASAPGSCDFEHPDGINFGCDLSQDNRDDFNWTVERKVNDHLYTDHTPGRGRFFLHANAFKQKDGDTARIFTNKVFPATGEKCRVRFWYYLYGLPQSGMLKVYLVTGYGLDILVWSTAESAEQRWMYSSVILASHSPFQVAFEAQVGGNKTVDIALDDISFTLACRVEGPSIPQPSCPPDLFTCIYRKECVPLSAKCNGTEECTDGSDEILCPTSSPVTTSPEARCKATEFQCLEKCVPLIMRCDGVIDCPLGEDERSCTMLILANDSVLCVPSNTWVTIDQRCDGSADCSNLIDESGCSECPSRYCRNGGQCLLRNKVPVCRCKEKWQGTRCHIHSPEMSPNKPEADTTDWWIGITIGLTFLLTEVIIIFVCYFSKRKHKGDPTSGFPNPNYAGSSTTSQNELYESVHPNVQISVFPWKSTPEDFRKELKACSFSNPLYGNKEENL